MLKIKILEKLKSLVSELVSPNDTGWSNPEYTDTEFLDTLDSIQLTEEEINTAFRDILHDYVNQIRNPDITLPYLFGGKYNPQYNDVNGCECGHSYDRHFDTYEGMRAVGCKYCWCGDFKEQK